MTAAKKSNIYLTAKTTKRRRSLESHNPLGGHDLFWPLIFPVAYIGLKEGGSSWLPASEVPAHCQLAPFLFGRTS